MTSFKATKIIFRLSNKLIFSMLILTYNTTYINFSQCFYYCKFTFFHLVQYILSQGQKLLIRTYVKIVIKSDDFIVMKKHQTFSRNSKKISKKKWIFKHKIEHIWPLTFNDLWGHSLFYKKELHLHNVSIHILFYLNRFKN